MIRQPVYFLVNVTEPRTESQLNAVKEGNLYVVQEPNKDSYALDTTFISSIVFAAKAKNIIPITTMILFYPPKFPIDTGTNLGNGSGQLMFGRRKNNNLTTLDKKIYWEPKVILLSKKAPSDKTNARINNWKQKWARKSSLMSISIVDSESFLKFKKITQEIYFNNNTRTNTCKYFFNRVTPLIKILCVSISNTSIRQIANTSGLDLE